MSKLRILSVYRVVKRIEISRRDGKSNRGDFLIFVLLMLVKLSYARSEKLAYFTRADGEMCWLLAYFDNPVYRCQIKTLMQNSI